ncbi:serine/threonine-protein kinase [Yinghuangia soli]|uniref:non-specific serine/threonine protein kinase n=1 Tax=Yinghuangia soli TaxID=2908204 RepID=A0AA41QC05_9ACTN|nr:serine/threonine-protein kinase [Yinghuangia soli]MCF2533997.1 protein kinase [Yinghuangia soli]
MRVLNERYELVEPIGHGGMGQVWRGRDRELARTVAIKTLPVELSRQAEFRERFQREARAVAALAHPGITVLHDFGRDDSADPVPFLVMEHVDGSSLAGVVRSGPVPVARAAGIVRDIADALAHSHGLGIVHRDIKPSNVMLTRYGTVKVLDFGIARMLSDTATRLTTTGGIVGTPTYMSPEQAMGEQVDARTDQYSLGCVLYELLCGQPPFLGDSAFAIMNQHFVKPASPPSGTRPDVPPGLDAVVLRMLAKDPAQRFGSMADVWNALGPYADTAPATDRRGPAPDRTQVPTVPGPPTHPPGAPATYLTPPAQPPTYPDPFGTPPPGMASDQRPAFDPRYAAEQETQYGTGGDTWHTPRSQPRPESPPGSRREPRPDPWSESRPEPWTEPPREATPPPGSRAAARRAAARARTEEEDERPRARHRGQAAAAALLALAVAATTTMNWVSLGSGSSVGGDGTELTGVTLAGVHPSSELPLPEDASAYTGLDSYLGQGVLAATLLAAALLVAGLVVSSLLRPARALLVVTTAAVVASMAKPSLVVWTTKDARDAELSFNAVDALSFTAESGLIAALLVSILAMTASQLAAGKVGMP